MRIMVRPSSDAHHHMHHSASSTSPPSTPVSASVNNIPKALKRKRAPGMTASNHSKDESSPKKKKASRACLNCQKAHLTCNDTRPCQRCVKKGIPNCVEGNRKRAKYLLSDEELETLKQGKPDEPHAFVKNMMESDLANGLLSSEPTINMNFDQPFSFGSEATNLEYSMLTAMLGNVANDSLLPTTSSAYTSHPQSRESISHAPPMPTNHYPLDPEPWAAAQNAQNNPSTSRPPSAMYQNNQPEPPMELPIIPSDTSAPHVSPASSLPTSQPSYAQLPGSRDTMASFPARSTSFLRTNTQLPQHPQQFSSGMSEAAALAHAAELVEPSTPHGVATPAEFTTMRIAEVYQSIARPYDYTQGYHFLMQYLHQNFDKNDILRVVRALAIFRPSLIALQMPLTEEDEIFVEKCFQRSLIELEKLISFSGTPTVVWRRTGEICLAGMEFSMLTGWSQEELVGQRKYIYEVFERQSLVEYWEKFAAHAFENATQSVYSHCVLLKPSGEPVPCAFCFSIRRDLFDLPNLVIGQWLPLLG